MVPDLSVLRLNINGADVTVAPPAHWTLLEVLRYQLGLTGSKQGCDKGDCGACTVLFDGKARLSCITLAVDAVGHRVTTIEGWSRRTVSMTCSARSTTAAHCNAASASRG